MIPALLSIAAFALAIGADRLDVAIADSGPDWLRSLLYRGGIEGARTLLATVAGSMITVAGVTFSVTVVALSLASSQFGPRLLMNFMRDRINQLVLGTFIATFLYCLVSLGNGGAGGEVPLSASASIALLLSLASVAVLIYFIHHVSSTIRAEHVVDVVARDVAGAVEELLHEEDPGTRESGEFSGEINFDASLGKAVLAEKSGYIQFIDHSSLVSVASSADVLVKLPRRAGHFVVQDEALAVVMPNDACTPEVAERLKQHILIGRSRTDDQDTEYGIHQLVEVAVRALSPGINDPYTANSCIDWLASALSRVAGGRMRPCTHFDEHGTLRLITDPVTFDGLVNAAFDQIRQCAYAMPSVSIRLMEALAIIGSSIKDPAYCAVIRKQADMLMAGTDNAGIQDDDLDDLRDRRRAVERALEN